MSATKDLWTGLGCAAVIFAFFLGATQCQKQCNEDNKNYRQYLMESKAIEHDLEEFKSLILRAGEE